MILARLILSPFALIYGAIIAIRNLLYRSNILTRTSFDIPIICVGNLSVGGTGKTPHIEWLIRLLKPHYGIAVLSRGYKRKTTGYLLADEHSTPGTIGDEPFQIARKFPDVSVAVSESRVMGIPHLLGDAPQTQVVLMDDGFQHLPINPGYSIILTDYHNPFYDDWLMPAGTLREFRSAYKRAQCIIVTKCPEISEAEKQQIITKINSQHRLVLFSSIRYQDLVQLSGPAMEVPAIKQVLAFSGIARQELFINELQQRFSSVSKLSFSDHKAYDQLTLTKIAKEFRDLPEPGRAIITTEKDAVKLDTEAAHMILGEIPVFYLPIGIHLSPADKQKLTDEILPFIQSFDTGI